MGARITNWVAGLSFLVGVWLMAAPWTLQYDHVNNVVFNELIVGALIALVSLGMFVYKQASGLLNAILGVWLLVATFILGFSNNTNALWNELIIGAALLISGVGVAYFYHDEEEYVPAHREAHVFGEKIDHR